MNKKLCVVMDLTNKKPVAQIGVKPPIRYRIVNGQTYATWDDTNYFLIRNGVSYYEP